MWWSKVLTVLGWVWGKKSWLVAGLGALLLASAAWIYVQGLRLEAVRATAERRILTEQAEHNATRALLHAADIEIVRLRSALDAAQNSTAAVQESLRQALAREEAAAGAAAARQRILVTAKPRPRTEPEKTEVVDDATRAAVAARLNRPL
jgi:hypothetical protein